MRFTTALLALMFTLFIAQFATAESMRCKNDIVQIGDTKADIVEKCGAPEITDPRAVTAVVHA